MIVRVVKMNFREEELEEFLIDFNEFSKIIRKMDGCNHLELWQDVDNKSICFTYSVWESQSYLDKYRDSAFFKEIWPRAKARFKEKPEAWSVNQLKILK